MGKSPIIEITQKDYEAIRDSHVGIFELILIEQKYDNLIENYLEYENYLMEVAQRQIVDRNYFLSGVRQASNTIQRRIMNVLNSSYAFIKQSKHHLNMIFPKNSEITKNYESFLNQQYDKYLGYRVMAALRNHSQHFNFPAPHLKLSMKRVNRSAHNQLLVSITPSINVSDLAKNKKFKPKILRELKELGEIIDIKPLLREYISCISRALIFLRDTTKDKRDHCDEMYKQALGKLNNAVNDTPISNPAAAIENKDGTMDREVIINDEFIDLRKQYEKKNNDLSSLDRQFATGEVIEDS